MTNYQVLDQTFKALADPTRRAVVARLIREPASVSELAEPFEMALPSLMQHLHVLESGGLIRSHKVGRTRTCHVEPAALKTAEHWLAEQRALWEMRLDQLDAHLRDMNAETRKGEDT